GSPVLLGRVREIAADLTEKDLPWDDWQILDRLLLQLDRALRGEKPLFAQAVPHSEEKVMPETKQKLALPVSVEAMSSRELISHVMENATLLAKKEIELAKAELKQDLKSEVAMAKGLGIGALCAIWTVSLMLVAGALALGNVITEWGAA